MTKILFGIIVGVVVALPVGAFAWSQAQKATPIIGADCNGPYKVDKQGYTETDSQGNNVYDPNGTNARCSVTVYRFTDNGHTCYLVKGTNAGGIDCL